MTQLSHKIVKHDIDSQYISIKINLHSRDRKGKWQSPVMSSVVCVGGDWGDTWGDTGWTCCIGRPWAGRGWVAVDSAVWQNQCHVTVTWLQVFQVIYKHTHLLYRFVKEKYFKEIKQCQRSYTDINALAKNHHQLCSCSNPSHRGAL